MSGTIRALTQNEREFFKTISSPLSRLPKYIEKIRKLLDCDDVDVNCIDGTEKDNPTASCIAAKQGNVEVLRLLIEHGANLDLGDKDGTTPLMYAAQNCRLEAVRLLIESGAAVNLTCQGGTNALHYAATGKVTKIVVDMLLLLVQYNCSLLLKDHKGKRPLDYASDESCAQFLRAVEWSIEQLKENAAYLWFLFIGHDELKDKVDAYARADTELIEMRNEMDQVAIQIASPVNKATLQSILYFCGRYKLQDGPPLHRSATCMLLLAVDYGLESEYRQAYEWAEKTVAGAASHYVVVMALKRVQQRLGEIQPCSLSPQSIDDELLEEVVEDMGLAQETTSAADVLSQYASAAQFLRLCNTHFGDQRRVAIKFMISKDMWSRELLLRKQNLDPRYVVNLLPSPELQTFQKEVDRLSVTDERFRSIGDPSTAKYRYGLFMPAAHRSLDAIYRYEIPDDNKVRSLMQEVGEALSYMHREKAIVHGDLKAANAVRIDGSIRLIDLDASVPLNNTQRNTRRRQQSHHTSQACSFFGEKFSSGVLPPEMFCQLFNDDELKQYTNYWQQQSEIPWDKVKPFVTKNGEIFVVKTFRSSSQGDDAEGEGNEEEYHSSCNPVFDQLPYEMVPASIKLDVWSFGVLLFMMLSGCPLFPVDRNDDLSNASSAASLARMSTQPLQQDNLVWELIDSKITDPRAQELLKGLLHPQAMFRWDMERALQHAYFHTEVDSHGEVLKQLERAEQQRAEIAAELLSVKRKTMELMKLSSQILGQVLKTEEVLRHTIFEVNEVDVPTCFVIVGHKLPYYPSNEAETKSTSFIDVAADAVEATSKMMDRLNDLQGKLVSAIEDPVSAAITAARRAASQLCPEGLKDQQYYFYLVNELTMLPIVPEEESEHYPVVITKPGQMMPKLVPLLNVTYKTALLLNGAAGIARCCGYPVPTIPGPILSKVQPIIKNMSRSSSVEGFECLSKCLNEEQNQDPQTVRGKALRDLKAFYKAHGGEEIWNAVNLCRFSASSGATCWTTEENYNEVITKEGGIKSSAVEEVASDGVEVVDQSNDAEHDISEVDQRTSTALKEKVEEQCDKQTPSIDYEGLYHDLVVKYQTLVKEKEQQSQSNEIITTKSQANSVPDSKGGQLMIKKQPSSSRRLLGGFIGRSMNCIVPTVEEVNVQDYRGSNLQISSLESRFQMQMLQDQLNLLLQDKHQDVHRVMALKDDLINNLKGQIEREHQLHQEKEQVLREGFKMQIDSLKQQNEFMQQQLKKNKTT